MFPGQAAEIDRRMLDVHDDRPLAIQKEDVVRIASRQSLRRQRRFEAVRRRNGSQQICWRTCNLSRTAHCVSFS